MVQEVPHSRRKRLLNTIMSVVESEIGDREFVTVLKELERSRSISYIVFTPPRRSVEVDTVEIRLEHFIHLYRRVSGEFPDYRIGDVYKVVRSVCEKYGRDVGLRFTSTLFLYHVDTYAVVHYSSLVYICPPFINTVLISIPRGTSYSDVISKPCLVDVEFFLHVVDGEEHVKPYAKALFRAPTEEMFKIPINVPIAVICRRDVYTLAKNVPKLFLELHGVETDEKLVEDFKKTFPNIDEIANYISKILDKISTECEKYIRER